MRRRWSAMAVFFIATAAVACEPPPSQDQTSAEESAQVEAEPQIQEDGPGPAGRVYFDFADIVEEVRPAVVNIYTRTRAPVQMPHPFAPRGMVPRERIEQSLGSGFIFDPDGLVLTNEHVVRDATEISVRLFDERVFVAEVIGSDPQTDTAVLQLRNVTEELPSIELGDSDGLRVGNWVLAIGNPLGLTSTVTAGIASATGRQVLPPGDRLRFQDFIQTDASINPGNSGGPLVDMSGRVIGIATAVSAEGQGLGFAIPINMVREILPALIEEGRVERSWLGIYVGGVPPALREELDLDDSGALITRVVRSGPADRAGLEPGDVILSVAGEEISDSTQLSWVAANLGVGTEVEVEILRGNRRLSLPLVMGALPE